MNQKKLISVLAVLSSILMITPSFVLICSYIFDEGDADAKVYYINGFINVFMILVYIFFAIYVLTCFFKEKCKPLGISMVILFNHSYFVSFYLTLSISLTRILSFVFRIIFAIIFSISLYKKYNKKIFIIGTVAVIINICIELKLMYDFASEFIRAFIIFKPNLVLTCIDFAGFILFLLTIYFMSFYQISLSDKNKS